jgi:hypothetical protein
MLGPDIGNQQVLVQPALQRLCVEHSGHFVNPWWIVGLCEGEGNFSVEVPRNKSMRLGYQVNLNFNIAQHETNRIILDKVHTYFGFGVVRKNNNKGMMIFRVRGLDDIMTGIIPFFEEYP